MEYLDDTTRALRELRRVLRPGGHFSRDQSRARSAGGVTRR
ncbi:methyltransferase domain-containing protein [Mycobacterium sp. URHB0021]